MSWEIGRLMISLNVGGAMFCYLSYVTVQDGVFFNFFAKPPGVLEAMLNVHMPVDTMNHPPVAVVLNQTEAPVAKHAPQLALPKVIPQLNLPSIDLSRVPPPIKQWYR